MTPFEVLYGRKRPTIARYLRGSTTNEVLDMQLADRDSNLALLKSNLMRAQKRMRVTANKHRRDVQFDLDDWVYVKLQPYRQGSVRLQRHHKLGHRYFGPYRVLEKIGTVAYKLDLPESAQIHPVFHVSLLRKCIGKPGTQITPLHLVDSSSTLSLYPEAILKNRRVLRGDLQVTQGLVKWNGLPVDEATWEDYHHLCQLYPNFNHEDKVNLDGDGIVMDPINEGVAQQVSTNKEPNRLDQVIEPKQSKRPKRLPSWTKDYELNKGEAQIKGPRG